MASTTTAKQVYVRVGHRYVKTIGGYGILGGRSFDIPVDVAWDSKSRLHVVNRPEGNVRITVVDIDDEYYHEYVRPGTQEGQLTWPGFIAIDGADTVYVTDQLTHTVSLFGADGTFISRWGISGSGNGELNQPCGIALDSNEDLYIADTGNNRIQKMTSSGTFILGWGEKGDAQGQFSFPWGIALDDEDNVYVADWGNDRIQKFNSGGEYLMSFGSTGSGDGQLRRPSGVAVDRGGDVYVADWANDRVVIFDPKGMYQLKLTGDATLSKWGLEMLLASPDFLRERHNATLEPERRMWRPSSVKVDSEDRIYVVDSTRHRLQIYQKDSVTVDADWIDLDNPKRELQER